LHEKLSSLCARRIAVLGNYGLWIQCLSTRAQLSHCPPAVALHPPTGYNASAEIVRTAILGDGMKRTVALVLSLLIALLWAAILFYISQMSPPDRDSTLPVYLAITYVAIASITVVAAFVLLLILFWRALKLMLAFTENIGVDSRIFLLSLGLACWLVPGGISSLANFFYALLWFPFRLVEDATQSLTDAWRVTSSFCSSNVPPSNCVAQVCMGFLSAWASSLQRTYSNEDNYLFNGWYYIAIFFGVFALCASALRAAFLPIEGGDRVSALVTIFRTMPYVRRQNLLFAALVFVAGYLSIAAVAAIPGLQETATTSPDTSVDTLKKSLEDSLNSTAAQLNAITSASQQAPAPASSSQASPAPTPAPDPLDSIRQILQQSSASLAERSRTSPEAEANLRPLTTFNTFASQQLGPIAVARDKLKRARDALALVVASSKLQAKTDAIRTYTVANLNRKGSRETNQHYLLIVSWFEQRVALLDGQLAGCDARIDAFNSTIATWAQDVQTWLNVSPAELGPNTFTSGSEPFRALRFSPDLLYSPDRGCRLDTSDFPPPPDRPPLGADLGPFRFVASWLLRMESMPLALIVGLLGFGLLGSACSTFVRERRASSQSEQNQPPPSGSPENQPHPRADQQNLPSPSGSQPDRPLVSDLAGVLIRGLSAAIVVFLAVEGGLAVFSNPNAIPNPYVLLLTCLVGAVYSETVWEWAEGNLNQRFPQNQAGQHPNPQPSPRTQTTNPPAKPTPDPQSNPPPSTNHVRTGAAEAPLAERTRRGPSQIAPG